MHICIVTHFRQTTRLTEKKKTQIKTKNDFYYLRSFLQKFFILWRFTGLQKGEKGTKAVKILKSLLDLEGIFIESLKTDKSAGKNGQTNMTLPTIGVKNRELRHNNLSY